MFYSSGLFQLLNVIDVIDNDSSVNLSKVRQLLVESCDRIRSSAPDHEMGSTKTIVGLSEEDEDWIVEVEVNDDSNISEYFISILCLLKSADTQIQEFCERYLDNEEKCRLRDFIGKDESWAPRTYGKSCKLENISETY